MSSKHEAQDTEDAIWGRTVVYPRNATREADIQRLRGPYRLVGLLQYDEALG